MKATGNLTFGGLSLSLLATFAFGVSEANAVEVPLSQKKVLTLEAARRVVVAAEAEAQRNNTLRGQERCQTVQFNLRERHR
ncbi:hypothetical protein [Microvirga alba]|uniref:Uncharacterized protein n=1 Tax=Microvirga alba TaxID=2791025 RepID=A0A931BQM9_9HYPH|nr:hypothetical protein [Microvirga alba]MBF9235692.1 hypothetical protein [Microvirga alba]